MTAAVAPPSTASDGAIRIRTAFDAASRDGRAALIPYVDRGNLTAIRPSERKTAVVLFSLFCVLGLFVTFVWRGLRVGLHAPDAFGSYLALGITLLVATQTLVNLGVVTGLLPTKGLPLPFISFGGSALLMTMVSTGVLLNISQHSHA